jgi:hypothetical protein
VPLSQAELFSKITELNRPDSPFVVTMEKNQLSATWDLVDAKWITFFDKAGIKDAYRLTLNFDQRARAVYPSEELGHVHWNMGVPIVSFSGKRNSGLSALLPHPSNAEGTSSFGREYQFDFNPDRIKNPIYEIILQAGWQIKQQKNRAVLVGLLLVLLSSVAFGGFYFYQKRNDVAYVAEHQLSELRKDNIEAAYADNTEAYQQKESLTQFTKFVEMYPELKHHEGVFFTDKTVEGNRAYVHGILRSSDSTQLEIEYDLLKEDRDWKVLSIDFPKDHRQVSFSSPTAEENIDTTSPIEFPAVQYLSRLGTKNTGELSGNNLLEVRIDSEKSSNGRAQTNKTKFTQNPSPLYVSVLARVVEKTSDQITAVLIEDETNTQLDTRTEIITHTGQRFYTFELSPPQGWKKTRYKVITYLSTGEAVNSYFTIQ